jgi:cytochrome c5
MNMRKTQRWILIGAAAGLILTLGADVPMAADREQVAAPEKSAETPEVASSPTETEALDGAKVYTWTCGSCHSERRPRERTDGEWDIIAMHMRVRANLTAAQTRAVLDYLQENN